ncbi:sphingomyelin phosphodiesterase 4 [Musca vetustissima]|uniref:sphingomyelin phosphodiesterase 4 n=1 Tax=Musca vetustissima TaxID=27455 RepID=UPI002AB75821|nr:sphingomyelin phosphodiesterase 4 [Musca vetustissima]
MAFYNENIGNRILELLSFPLFDRCHELNILFERCNLRELQELFPTIVKSVFGIGAGGLGWGLRTTTKENSAPCFDILYNFFAPMGPMLRLCYNLLNDQIKFELSLEHLPHKMVELIHSGQYSMFYADLVNIDPFRRQVTSLSLNAFDYYMLHFVIHATFPLHKMYPAALQVHNERMKTVYFFLTAEYLCNFLPSRPDAMVMPSNICSSVKAPQPMPVQQLQPKRSPKYLKIPQTNQSLYGSGSNNMSQINQRSGTETSPRAHAWRTESVLHFFIDTWLRYDVDEARDLPSSEFIRVVRILIKQTHSFANSANLDQTAMSTLRKIAQPMMKPRIYPFIKSIIGRWPLDSSMSVVLELWLSYIQPWRYTFEWQNNSGANIEVPINSRFDSFIADNLVIYTQIFVHILPRFERLDFTSLRNVIMLHRLVKVFSQSTLPQKLYNAEKAYAGNSIGFVDSPRKHSTFLRLVSVEWDGSFYHEDVYTPMFGTAIKCEIEQFIKTVHISRMYVGQEISAIRREQMERRKSLGFFRKLFSSVFSDMNPSELKLQEISKIPDILDLAVRSLSQMFNVELPNISMEQLEPVVGQSFSKSLNFSIYDNSDYLDISRLSPRQMMNNLAHMNSSIDPTTVPIQTHECTVLVRLLHQVSCVLNDKFGDQFNKYWSRPDFLGKLSHQLLYPPMTAQWFEKPRGVSELCEEDIPARLCLRVLGSYRTLALIALTMLIGYIFWGSASYGVVALFFISVIYIFIMALIS